MTRRWTHYAMAGVGLALFLFAFSPLWKEWSRGQRIRATLYTVVFMAVCTYLHDRFVEPAIERYLERMSAKREQKKAAEAVASDRD